MAEIPDARKYEEAGERYSAPPSARRSGVANQSHSQRGQEPDEMSQLLPWLIGGAILFVVILILL